MYYGMGLVIQASQNTSLTTFVRLLNLRAAVDSTVPLGQSSLDRPQASIPISRPEEYRPNVYEAALHGILNPKARPPQHVYNFDPVIAILKRTFLISRFQFNSTKHEPEFFWAVMIARPARVSRTVCS